MLACGETFGVGASDAYLVKFSADGEEVWKRFFGKNLSESAEDLVQLPDGGIFMGGIDYSLSDEEDPPGDKGVYVLRTDRDGMVN